MGTDGPANDPRSDERARSDGDGRPDLPFSRRGFVLAAGGAAAFPFAGGTGATSPGRRIVVGATAPYRPAVDALARGFERSEDGTGIELRRASSDPTGALGRDLDVLVTGFPGRASDAGEVGIAIHGGGTLARPDGEWRECLSARTLRERAIRDRPVETWSETDRASAQRASDRGGATGCTAQSPDGQSDPTTLVRGTRSYQYATGRGGVGHYEVSPDAVGGRDDVRGDADGSAVPVVRVGYVYADREARNDERVDRFLEFYRARSVTAADGIDHFAGPTGERSGAGRRA